MKPPRKRTGLKRPKPGRIPPIEDIEDMLHLVAARIARALLDDWPDPDAPPRPE